ncbi:MAG: hypothetical protein WCX71_01850 [Candidatus Buchananbacteria bacterium]
MVFDQNLERTMKKLIVLSLVLSCALAGCAHSYARYEAAGNLHTGALVNYRLDTSVVFTISGRLGASITVPPAQKSQDKNQPPKPTVVKVELAPNWTYEVKISRFGQQWPYEHGPVYVDWNQGDTMVEGKVYDFGIYAH